MKFTPFVTVEKRRRNSSQEYPNQIQSAKGLYSFRGSEVSYCSRPLYVLMFAQIDLNTTNDAILFEGNTWHQLLKDLEEKPSHVRNILHEYSIASVKRTNIIVNKSRKIPFFASIIVHIEGSLCDPSIVLKDPSGVGSNPSTTVFPEATVCVCSC